MISLQRARSVRLLTTCLVTSVWLASAGAAFAQSAKFVAPMGSKPLKLYDAPGKPSAQTYQEGQPLPVAGEEKGGFIPVDVHGHPFWVDSMDVRRDRQSKAPCTQSAGVSAAGTLGAATNRCTK
jgi:hypothetical protein